MKTTSNVAWRALISGVLAVLVAAVAARAAETAAGWPQFRGPGGQGVAAGAKLPSSWSATENVVWKTALPGAGTSSPIIVGGRVFLTCYSGYNVPGQPPGAQEDLKLHVVCLDRDGGRILWTKEVAPKLPEQATIRDGHGYASNTPAADGERLYVFFGKTGVMAFDFEGRQLWQADVGAKTHGWGSGASPVLHGNLVIVNASIESGHLVALDKKTGKDVWRASGIRDAWNTPILVSVEGGKTELVVAIHGKVLGLDPGSGGQLWSCATDIPWYMVPSLVANEGVVYALGGRPGAALAVRAGGRGDVTATHRLWTSNKGSNVSSPVFHEGRLYWMHESQGMAFCADAKTGETLYEQKIERAGQVYASAVLADGKLYYVSRSGRTFVVAARPQFEQLAANDLGDRSTCNATPAVAGNRLYLRSDKFLYCLGNR